MGFEKLTIWFNQMTTLKTTNKSKGSPRYNITSLSSTFFKNHLIFYFVCVPFSPLYPLFLHQFSFPIVQLLPALYYGFPIIAPPLYTFICLQVFLIRKLPQRSENIHQCLNNINCVLLFSSVSKLNRHESLHSQTRSLAKRNN